MSSAGHIITAYVFPSLGLALAIALYSSTLPTALKARRERALGALDAATVSMQFVNAALCLTYGILVKDMFIFFSNAPGLLLTLFYMSTCLWLATETDAVARLKVEVTVAVGVLVLLTELFLFCFVLHDLRTQIMIVGFSTSACCVLMYMAPLLNIVRAFRDRTAAAFVTPLVVVSLLCTLMWGGYGLFSQQDPFIYIPNGIGLVASSLQGVVILLFGRQDRLRTMSRRQLLREDSGEPQFSLPPTELPPAVAKAALAFDLDEFTPSAEGHL